MPDREKEMDYSVTWNEVKERVRKKLEKCGISGDDKVSMGDINYAVDKVWEEMYNEMKVKRDERS